MKLKIMLVALVAATLGTAASPALAQAGTEETPIVRAVLFFSPTCPHCEAVINDHLPGIFEQFGGEPTVRFDDALDPEDRAFYEMSNGTLDLLIVDATVDAGGDLFAADTERFGLDRAGVPRLDIEDVYLVGDQQIPDELPGIIERGLASGGIPWPDVPGIDSALATIPEADSSADTAQGTTTTQGEEPVADTVPDDHGVDLPVSGTASIADRIGRDPVGNGLAIAVLVGLIASLVAVPILARRGSLGGDFVWLVPVLAIIGLGVSLYLAQVETSGAEAVCGPVGDCNTVQQSSYATLFGVPIGVIGVISYAGVFISWIVARAGKGRVQDIAMAATAAVALGGTAFSIYLTFLEPFVIGATCMWCLTSALAIVGLLWASAHHGWAAYQRLRGT